MPVSRQMLLYLVNYMAWADRQLLSACAALTPEEQNQDMGLSHSGILRTLRHIYIAESIWLKHLIESKLPPFSVFADPKRLPLTPAEPDLCTLQRCWPDVWRCFHQYVETAPEAELAGELRAVGGGIHRWKILLHVVNHGTLHRGQIMGMLRQLGKQPPATDIFVGYHLSQPTFPGTMPRIPMA
ncbi:MAG: DinB family protein [Terracidiphilus sp.]|jgi:uncharacterized damage-inducible protein DinB